MLAPTASHVLLASLLASFLPCAFSLSTAGLKQATRQQVVDRQLARRLSPLRPRQSPAPCVPPNFTFDGPAPAIVSPDSLVTYYGYYSNSGVQENADNDGNTNPLFPPETEAFSAADVTTALTVCADYAYGMDYASFDLSFLQSTCAYSCTVYFGPNIDTLAFNVPNADVVYGYGYSDSSG